MRPAAGIAGEAWTCAPEMPGDRGVVDKVLLVVLDGLGVGAHSDSPERFRRANSLTNAFERLGRAPNAPFLAGLGLLAAAGQGEAAVMPWASWGRTRQQSPFNESYAAHWEMAGCVTYNGSAHPEGLLPDELEALEAALGTSVIGNLGLYPRADLIPNELIQEHRNTGRPILLVQPDLEPISVVALYALPDVISAPRLFGLVERGAPLLRGTTLTGRLCARVLSNGGGRLRTMDERRDVPFFDPPDAWIMPAILASGRSAIATGKVAGLFGNAGFTTHFSEWGDEKILENTLKAVSQVDRGLVWANFNTLSRPAGAGADIHGWTAALERYDGYLEMLYQLLRPSDLLIVTGDHGVDPSLDGSHTFEWCPLLVCPGGEGDDPRGVRLGDRVHADIAATIADYWGLDDPRGQSWGGTSFARSTGVGGPE